MSALPIEQVPRADPHPSVPGREDAEAVKGIISLGEVKLAWKHGKSISAPQSVLYMILSPY